MRKLKIFLNNLIRKIMTTLINFLIVVLDLPRKWNEKKATARAIIEACANFSLITFPAGLIAAAQTALSDFEIAQDEMSKRTVGNKAKRDKAWITLYILLKQLKNAVQDAVDGNPADGEVYITSCQLKSKVITVRQRQKDAVCNASIEGSVIITGEILEKTKLHGWRISKDGITFSDLDVTIQATKLVTGLNVGEYYYFQHRCLDKNNQGNWGQILKILVI
jgi:hypothetical protein